MRDVRKVWAPFSDGLDSDEEKCCLIYAEPHSAGFYDEGLAIMPWASWVRVLDSARMAVAAIHPGQLLPLEALADALREVAGEVCNGDGKVLGGPCNKDGEICDHCKGTGSRKTERLR
jgi:hypothetical protein